MVSGEREPESSEIFKMLHLLFQDITVSNFSDCSIYYSVLNVRPRLLNTGPVSGADATEAQ